MLLLFVNSSIAEQVSILVETPVIESQPYHKPYVAVWLETPKRKDVYIFAFWKEQADWFKDLRQWWRKIARKSTPNYDGVTGATRNPGIYQLLWQGKLSSGKLVSPSEYVLNIEAVREQGSREYLRQVITLGNNQLQSYQL